MIGFPGLGELFLSPFPPDFFSCLDRFPPSSGFQQSVRSMSSRPGDCVTPAADSTPTPLSDSLLGAHSSSVTKSPGDSARRKRSLASSSSSSSSSSPIGNTPAIDNSRNRRKTQKVSRACDFCRIKKLRCNGTLPCNTCVKRNLVCVYAAKYSRGRPPTPPAAVATIRETFNLSQAVPV